MQEGRALRIAGITEHYTADKSAAIPSQWQRFAPYIGHVPGQKGTEAYGVISFHETGEMDYTAGVEVGSTASISTHALPWWRSRSNTMRSSRIGGTSPIYG